MAVSLAVLRTIPIFASLSDDQLALILTSSQTVQHPGGVVLFYEGDPGEDLYVLLTGRVKVCLLGDQGQEIILAVLEPFSYFGEMAILDSAPRSATVVTLESSSLMRWSRNEFLDRVLGDKALARQILAHLVGCLRKANEQIRTMAMFDIHGRIVRTLLRLAGERGTRNQTGILIEPRPSQEMLAHMAGCQRETVSRAMRDLQNGGYVTVSKRSLVVEERALRHYWPSE
jgi:CRP/FNR family transcriptional regulator, cyclic AMP receptor protein